MLDIERGEDVDARCEDLLDVLVALGVLGTRRVRVGELVDQAQLWRAPQDRREVHLLKIGLSIRHLATAHDGQPLGEPGGLGTTVRLEQANCHVAARLPLGLALEQHEIGLSDPSGHPKEDLQMATAAPRLHECR